jgi:hypothetical protein
MSHVFEVAAVIWLTATVAFVIVLAVASRRRPGG